MFCYAPLVPQTMHPLHLNYLFSDIHVDSKCYAAATFLELNCDSSSNSTSVISIQWNATLFGQSDISYCCITECTILVIESEHFEGPHWDALTACNGQTTCRVQVQRSAIACVPVTDYETVTYRCVIPTISSTAATFDPTIHGQTDRWTHAGIDQTTSQEIVHTGKQKKNMMN